MNRPSVTITSVSTSPPSKWRIRMRSIAIPARNESASVVSRARPNGTPASCRPQAMKVLNMAISPWAKLTTPVERKMSTRASATAP